MKTNADLTNKFKIDNKNVEQVTRGDQQKRKVMETNVKPVKLPTVTRNSHCGRHGITVKLKVRFLGKKRLLKGLRPKGQFLQAALPAPFLWV